jgi:hypothetical protein
MAIEGQQQAGRPDDWTGRKVVTHQGTNLGKLEHVYLGRTSDRPTWGVVKKGRKRHFVPLQHAAVDERSISLPVERGHVHSAPAVPADRDLSPDTERSLERHYEQRAAVSDTQARQREEHGGFKIGAAFFGWIVAIGLTTILGAVVGGIATAVGASTNLTGQQATQSAGALGIVGAALLIVVLFVAYFGGGYVAGRLARFDGAKNGLGAWLIGLAIAILLAVAAAILGSEFNVLARVPTVPIPSGSLTLGGLIVLAVVVIASIAGAVLGGKAGERFHRKVDRAGL